jgi:hypothetical protein
VLTLFGVLPAAMAWQSRYGTAKEFGSSQPLTILPGGAPVILAVGGVAAAVVAYSSLRL